MISYTFFYNLCIIVINKKNYLCCIHTIIHGGYIVDDELIRKLILKYLKKMYDNDPHGFVPKGKIIKEIDVDDVKLERNIKYLENKGLIDVKWLLRGRYLSKINSYGIDYLELNEPSEHVLSNINFGSETNDVISSIVFETKDYVDNKLEEVSPEIKEKLALSYTSLTENDYAHNNVRIAFDCREIMKDFTDLIVKKYYVQGQSTPKRNETKNKLKIMLKTLSKSETTSRLIKKRFEYLINYFDVLSDYIQKNAHPEDFNVTREDAKCCLIYTYLFMRDVFKIIDATSTQ